MRSTSLLETHTWQRDGKPPGWKGIIKWQRDIRCSVHVTNIHGSTNSKYDNLN